MSLKADFTLEAMGLACPMPIVKTKKAMSDLVDGQILEVIATDKGSKANLAAWSESVGHQYIGTKEEDDLLKHYIRKCLNDTVIEKQHEQVIQIVELLTKVSEGGIILDVREEAEYAFGHISGAKSIPMGDLGIRMDELDKNQTIYVICRTGKRSDLAAQKLSNNGFANVWNVMPGMTQWTGKIKKQFKFGGIQNDKQSGNYSNLAREVMQSLHEPNYYGNSVASLVQSTRGIVKTRCT